MVYAYLQTGQDRAAKRWVDSAVETFSRFNPAAANGAAPASAAFFARAAIPARYCLERRDWAGATKLEPLAGRFPYADAITYFARGLGAAHLGDKEKAQAAIASLDQIHEKLATMGETYWMAQIDIQRREVAATLAFAKGSVADALAGMRAAADSEDKTTMSSVTPGPLVPAREMLGEMLLSLKQPAAALKEFEATLAQQPNRFWSIYGAAKAAKIGGTPPPLAAIFTSCSRWRNAPTGQDGNSSLRRKGKFNIDRRRGELDLATLAKFAHFPF
jgi:tetratricopeptide (TPR) repeat protein